MKKVIAILFITLFISACASKATWDNMSEEKIAAWKTQGVDAELASELTENAITPEKYGAWKAVKITDPETIIAWNGSKFSAEASKNWMSGGFTLDEAVDNRAKGLSPVKKEKVVEPAKTEEPAKEEAK
ncbi:hypothetical protein PQO03_19510 [Lentisphaera profundi]|uniref:Lipoprotein n=1 Tax=Lentisphaera profundi TaxID=1658616 RepID=A0ABY7VW63_9BACT|nr:hypothetical protein [Lentisphaera profundi]WDE98014.1 hypothetical protein PQO03_19510 [Lentisphaera profundi]